MMLNLLLLSWYDPYFFTMISILQLMSSNETPREIIGARVTTLEWACGMLSINLREQLPMSSFCFGFLRVTCPFHPLITNLSKNPVFKLWMCEPYFSTTRNGMISLGSSTHYTHTYMTIPLHDLIHPGHGIVPTQKMLNQWGRPPGRRSPSFSWPCGWRRRQWSSHRDGVGFRRYVPLRITERMTTTNVVVPW